MSSVVRKKQTYLPWYGYIKYRMNVYLSILTILCFDFHLTTVLSGKIMGLALVYLLCEIAQAILIALVPFVICVLRFRSVTQKNEVPKSNDQVHNISPFFALGQAPLKEWFLFYVACFIISLWSSIKPPIMHYEYISSIGTIAAMTFVPLGLDILHRFYCAVEHNNNYYLIAKSKTRQKIDKVEPVSLTPVQIKGFGIVAIET